MGELTGTNWLLVEGRLCYLQAGVSDRSGGWRGAGPRPIAVILGQQPPDSRATRPTDRLSLDPREQDPDAELFLQTF